MNMRVLLNFALIALAVANEPLLRGGPTGDDNQKDSAVAPYMDPKTVSHKLDDIQETFATADEQPKSRRKFVSYTSSYFERLWLKYVDKWANQQQICDVLMDQQAALVHDWLNLTCTQRYRPPYQWCIIDDSDDRLWYNTGNRDDFELSWVRPPEGTLDADAVLGGVEPIVPSSSQEHIVSKFVFLDEVTGEQYVEYIEPLVSHLRFALSKCLSPVPDTPEHIHRLTTFRGWIIPPPPSMRYNRQLYFDVGVSSWQHVGAGGSSLKYFTSNWHRHGISFDEIYAFDDETRVSTFYQELPPDMKVFYQKCTISGRPEEGSDVHPFIPNMINRKASKDDYVLFKIDIDEPAVEKGIVDFILQDEATLVSELVWEHHISGNYLMNEWGNPASRDQATLRESYDYFLRLRQKGIRGHSYV